MVDAQNQSRFLGWVEFHRRNPGVFDLFVAFARQARAARGSRRVGARMIGERIRWQSLISVDATDKQYQLNDHLWPYYARLAMAICQDLAGAFERRDQRFDASDEEIVAAHSTTVGGAA